MDENILHSRRNLFPPIRIGAKRRDGLSSAAASSPLTWSIVAEGDGLLDTRLGAKLVRELDHIGSVDRPGGQAGVVDDLVHRAVGQQVAVGDIGELVASLGFVHVVGGDEKGQALGGEAVDVLPEIAPRLWIDPRRRLVEQEQFRLMDQAGGEGHALLPSAGKFSRQLLRTVREPEFLDAFLHQLRPVFHAVHARDKIEILGNGQVLVEAETLRHIADLLLDRFAVVDDIVAEAGAAAGVGAEQAAKHADESRLAAAVGTEKSVDFAGGHLEIDLVDDGVLAEALCHPFDIDGKVVGHNSSLEVKLDIDGLAGMEIILAVSGSKSISIMKTSLSRLSWL